MAHARIFPRPQLGSPVLQKGRHGWTLEFESDRAQHADPLTGWAGGAEPRAQVQLTFPSQEAAIDFCERGGHSYTLVPATPHRLLLQSYAENFR